MSVLAPSPTVAELALAGFADALDELHAGGLRCRVVDRTSRRIDGELLGPRAGRAGEFGWAVDEPDTDVAFFSYIELRPGARGKGLGGAMETLASRHFASAGCRALRTKATDDGAFVWALRAWQFDTPDPAALGAQLADRAAAKLCALTRAELVDGRRVRALEQALRAGALSAAQAAGFDRDRAWPIAGGRSSWLGRELMLGNPWPAIKPLV